MNNFPSLKHSKGRNFLFIFAMIVFPTVDKIPSRSKVRTGFVVFNYLELL